MLPHAYPVEEIRVDALGQGVSRLDSLQQGDDAVIRIITRMKLFLVQFRI
jgi:hypothetical protein